VSPVVHRFDVVSSTQDEARRLVEHGEAGAGDVVVADCQTAGRGRFGRTWLSPIGGLYATFLVPSSPRIAVLAAVAALRACARFDVEVALKWPNDVVVEDRKLAGILIETAGDLALVGIGLNLDEAPLPTATSLRGLGRRVGRDELVDAIAQELEAEGDDALLDAYRRGLATLGRTVTVAMESGETVAGRAASVDDEGRLVVETPAGLRTISTGECTHLRA